MPRPDQRLFEFLPRLLSKRGFCSRKEAEQMVSGGRVTVNGVVKRDVLWKANPRNDVIKVDGKAVGKAALLYLKMNKPLGVVTTMKDPEGRKTVAALIPAEYRGVMPVGRLDQDSTGLLFLTNDHQLGERVAGADHRVKKTYRVVVSGRPDNLQLNPFRAGVELDGKRCRPAKVRIIEPGDETSTLEVILDEGKFRQIRRSLALIDVKVRSLTRVAIGSLELGDLAPGAVAPLTPTELAALRAASRESGGDGGGAATRGRA